LHLPELLGRPTCGWHTARRRGPCYDRAGGRSPLLQSHFGRPVVSLSEPAPAGDLHSVESRSGTVAETPFSTPRSSNRGVRFLGILWISLRDQNPCRIPRSAPADSGQVDLILSTDRPQYPCVGPSRGPCLDHGAVTVRRIREDS